MTGARTLPAAAPRSRIAVPRTTPNEVSAHARLAASSPKSSTPPGGSPAGSSHVPGGTKVLGSGSELVVVLVLVLGGPESRLERVEVEVELAAGGLDLVYAPTNAHF